MSGARGRMISKYLQLGHMLVAITGDKNAIAWFPIVLSVLSSERNLIHGAIGLKQQNLVAV
jgi:hypothetical protein